MKRFVVMVMVLMLLLCSSCSGEKPLSEHQFDLSTTSQGTMIEVENGYYLVGSNPQYRGSQVYYADKVDLTNWVILCNKPNCDHYSNCNADVGFCDIIQLSNNKIYYYGEDTIMRMDLTGGNQEMIKSLKPDGYGTWGTNWFSIDGKILCSYNVCLHNGWEEVETALQESRVILFDPEKGEERILYEVIEVHKSHRFSRVRNLANGTFDIGHLYLRETIVDEWKLQSMGASGMDMDWDAIESDGGYYEYIPETNELVKVDGEGYENQMGSIGERIYQFEPGVGITSGGEVVIGITEEKCYAGIVNEYLLVSTLSSDNPEEGIIFYDADGNKIGNLFDNEEGKRYSASIVGYSDEHLFIRSWVSGEEKYMDGYIEMHAIDVEALAKGKIEAVQCYSWYFDNN